jgi:hypothetical protein
MTIAAIETRYAGCRFRSRLEARWAVFFDFIEVQWEYEPQGYRIHDWAGAVWSGAYLPDFRLNGEWWVEVKGAPTVDDVRKAAAAAIPHGGLPGDGGILLLGPMGNGLDDAAEVELKWHKGDIYFGDLILASDSGDFNETVAKAVAQQWGHPRPDLDFAGSQPLRKAALDVARSARFEHGERG